MSEETAVITIRVPKRVKIAMKKAKVNVAEDVRGYLEARAKSIELHELLPKLHKRALKIKVDGDSTEIIKHYRDSI